MAVNAAFPAKPFTPGIAEPLPDPTKALLGEIIPLWIEAIENDDDKVTAGASCESIGKTSQLLGPSMFESSNSKR